MTHYIRNRQHMAPVPLGRGIAKQELRVSVGEEELVPWTEVSFNAETGEEIPPLPEYWAAVDEQVTLEVRYTSVDGAVSEAFMESYMQVDNYTPPAPAPSDLGVTEQVDELESETRPTV